MPTATSFETRDLRLMQAIAETGGVTRAARVLHISQSAVSHQLKDLESRLGVPLFARRGRGVQMTAAGRRVLDLSREVLEPMAKAETELRSGSQKATRFVRIATQCQTGYFWLPQVWSALSLRHPDTVLRIVPEATVDPLAALAAGEIDVALCFTPPPKRFRRVDLFHDELVAVVAPSHPLAKRDFCDGADLTKELLFLPDVSPAVRDQVRRQLFPAGGRFRGVSRIPLTEVILELVKARIGISILTSWSISGPAGRREVIPVRLTRRGLVRKWTAAYSVKSDVKDAIVTLVGLLRDRGAPPSTRSAAAVAS